MPNQYKTRVCAECGKTENKHWTRHWKSLHSMAEPRELLPGELPVNPIDDNWIFLIKDLKIRHLYQAAIFP
jgi:hypothetical protein